MSIPWTRSSFLLSVLLILVAGQGNGHQLVHCWSLPDGTDYVIVETSFESAQQRFNVVVACTHVQRRKAAIQEGVKKFHTCLCPISTLQSLLLPLYKLFCRLEHVVHVLTSGTCGTAVLVCSFICRVFSVWLVLSFQHNAFALAQESATCNQTDLHCCFQSCLDSCETDGTLDTAHAQSHEHVFVFIVQHDNHFQW